MIIACSRLSLADGKKYVSILRGEVPSKDFNKLVRELRDAIAEKAFTYQQVGLYGGEGELAELAHHNATSTLLKGSSNTFADLCVVNHYALQLDRLKGISIAARKLQAA